MKTPSNGPEVAEVTSMEDSMTPSNRPTPKAMHMMTRPRITLMILMAHNWWLSFIPLKHGMGRTKSSNVTVAREFKFETFKLIMKLGLGWGVL